jgi:very-short-patch-repair endonuclease
MLDAVMNPHPDAAHLALGSATAGAVSLAMCRAAGLSEDRVKWLIESGRWQSPLPRVYVAFSGPLPPSTMQHAVLLYAGPGAALSHQSAGFLWRLCQAPTSIHVSVPYLRKADPQAGLAIHRSRTLSDADVHPVFEPRRTHVERTVLNLLAGQPTADRALGLVADALRGRATTPDRLRGALLDHPVTRWRRVVLAALPDLRAGAQSALELHDARLRRRHGLPPGSRQARRTADGTEFLDVLIEQFRLHVELDGRLGHDRAREIWRDMKRDNRSEVNGLRHLRYGWADVVDRPCDVAIEQAVIMRQQGWTGGFRRCRRCPAPLPLGL